MTPPALLRRRGGDEGCSPFVRMVCSEDNWCVTTRVHLKRRPKLRMGIAACLGRDGSQHPEVFLGCPSPQLPQFVITARACVFCGCVFVCLVCFVLYVWACCGVVVGVVWPWPFVRVRLCLPASENSLELTFRIRAPLLSLERPSRIAVLPTGEGEYRPDRRHKARKLKSGQRLATRVRA